MVGALRDVVSRSYGSVVGRRAGTQAHLMRGGRRGPVHTSRILQVVARPFRDTPRNRRDPFSLVTMGM